ncbi:DNA-3-methyladenine glycosylase family protein [Terrabacter sp. 2RAF25]|uniref:DNA-3-methyladenine glycosylase family protein n=1 Tax=Terrabacter sp. 2RAF25 TaxID=3232998 RepID=UPI003F9C12A8
MTATRSISTNGPFSLEELALFGFGYRSETSFDGVMRLAFGVDDDLETAAGVEVRQRGDHLDLVIHGGADPDAVARQVARILSCDHDGDDFAALGRRDPVIGALQAVAPGLRPPLFHSPYDALIWSVVSARRPRSQGIRLRDRLGAEHGASFELAGRRVTAMPPPSRLGQVERVDGLPADRIPRLRAVADAAARGDLDVGRLVALGPGAAQADLQRLPGIGPFYSSLVVIRACGLADVLPIGEARSRATVHELYRIEAPMTDDAYTAFAERWRPWRTWATVLIRAASPRLAAGAVPATAG